MSSEDSLVEDVKTEVLFEAENDESSEEPPMEEWSSLIIKLPEENKKKLLFEEGLYHPGSGEICAKYIPLSDSDVFRHPYFNYPAITDPGVEKALLEPEGKIVYPEDGQELYIALCKEMNQCPVSIFYRNLLDEVINLRYYCVNPWGVRPMAMALSYNRIVKVLDLTDNYLNPDACYHLGDMLATNSTLKELILSGCKIGPMGVKRLVASLPINRSLCVLNLNRNNLGDTGVQYLAEVMSQGVDVQQLYLSYNKIGGKAAVALADAFESFNKLTHLDLSWNNLFTPAGTYNLLTRLAENNHLQYLNLAWNSLTGARIGTAIKNVTMAPNLRHLDLSNNRLSDEAISNMLGNIRKAKKLNTLNLSSNPMTPQDAVLVLSKLKLVAVKIQNLFLDNVFVNGEFLATIEQVKSMKSKKNAVITYGGIVDGFKPKGPDARELVLNRAEFLCKRPKKMPVDIALVALQIFKENNEIMSLKDFSTAVRALGAPVDDDLIDELVNVFSGPRTPKTKTINLKMLVDYVKRKWPERKLPPTPPPEPEPEPEPKEVKGKGKGKGKGKK